MKKIISSVLAVVMVLSLSVSVFAYNGSTVYNGYNGYYGNGYYNDAYYGNGYYNNGYYGNGYYGTGYGYYNPTGMRQSYSDEVYNYSTWFVNEFEEYGVEFHLYPTLPISRSDVFAPIGKAMERAYEDSNRNFSNNFGVPFMDFTWDPELATVAGGLYQRGIMSGYKEDNTIRFMNNITRAEFAKVLVTTAKNNGIYNGYSNINSTFDDIDKCWAKQYINECNAMGLMYGKSATKFAPNDLVTYEEYVCIMIRMARRTNNTYAFDVEDLAFGISDTMDIDFVEVELESDFTLSSYGTKTIYMSVGETKTVKVKVSPSDVEIKKSDVDWETNKSGYLKLGSDYVENDRYVAIDIKALKEGKVTLTAAASKDDDESVDYTIVISDDEDYYDDETYVTSITLNPTSVELNVGENKAITATVRPSNAADKSITWKSHNTNVAVVNQNGNITAVGIGNTTVSATANDGSGVIAIINVTVNAKTEIVVDNKAPVVECSDTIMKTVGQTGYITVTARDENLKSFNVSESDILGISKFLKIVEIKKISNNTVEIHYQAMGQCSGELSIAAGVAVDEAGNTSAESLGVRTLINPVD